MQRDTVTVERFYTDQAEALGLKLMAGANGLKRVIREPTVNRPGLVMSGFTRYFANKRVQVIGNAEAYFSSRSRPPNARNATKSFFHLRFPASCSAAI
jgi:HPr kinase/phosphorylase